MYTLYKFHFLNGISEINQLFDDILIIWPAPVHNKFIHNLSKIKIDKSNGSSLSVILKKEHCQKHMLTNNN